MNAPVASSLQQATVTTGMRSDVLAATDKLVVALLFLYCLAYENIFFLYSMEVGGPVFATLTNAIKLLLPVVLLAFTGLPAPQMLARGPAGLYLFFFAAFLLWAIVPTWLYGDPLLWLKLLPRLMFCLAVVAFFSRRPAAFSPLAKLMVSYVLLALLQYVLVYASGAYEDPMVTEYARLAGPFGLLGNVSSTFFLPGAPFPFVRLTGFWLEPSNAAGSAFASFFLCRYLATAQQAPVWRAASYACCIAAVLCLSLAGYFALGAALAFGMVFSSGTLTAWRALRLVLLLPLVVVLVGLVAFGRGYVAEHHPDNLWLRALVGARDAEIAEDVYDASDGRLDVARMAVERAQSTVIGVGIQEVGPNGIAGPASAPLYWLFLTGFPGLLLILCREMALLGCGRSALREQQVTTPLILAWVALMAQQLSYGIWMNPSYLILAAMILALSYGKSPACRKFLHELRIASQGTSAA